MKARRIISTLGCDQASKATNAPQSISLAFDSIGLYDADQDQPTKPLEPRFVLETTRATDVM
jgi:hypothetical protein